MTAKRGQSSTGGLRQRGEREQQINTGMGSRSPQHRYQRRQPPEIVLARIKASLAELRKIADATADARERVRLYYIAHPPPPPLPSRDSSEGDEQLQEVLSAEDEVGGRS